MADPKPKEQELTEFEKVDLEFKRMQIELFREQMAERNDKKIALQSRREKQVREHVKGEAEKARRQASCRHRKGGRNNQFAKGDGTSYSINKNTYPDGREVIMCTRCWREVEKPNRSLRKSDPKLYEKMSAEWVVWDQYPTDNAPSGGRIFEIEKAA